jgi:ribosomal protein S18 acetylase RimI-like enzyme
MSITYAIAKDLPPEQLAEVFRRSGIRRPVDDLERIGKMISRADLLITARDDDRLVGVARSITDFCFCCYLSDLAVDRDYQRQGIGKELVRFTREAIGDQTMLLLIAAPEADDYYPRIGFSKMDRAWVIDRRI